MINHENRILSLPIESLSIYLYTPTGEVKFQSLKSAFINGLDMFEVGDHIRFENNSMLNERNNMSFILPLISRENSYNIIKRTIYFFYLENVKYKKVTIQINEDKALQVYCSTDSLIFHAKTSSIKVNVSDTKNTLQLQSYYHVDFQYNKRRYELSRTRNLRRIMNDVIIDGIPVILSGRSGSGKTTIVHRYCESAGIPLVTYYCSASSTKEELFSSEQNGVFVDAFVNGKVLLMEGIAFTPALLLNEIMKSISKRMIGGKAMNSDFRLIGTHNSDFEALEPHLSSFFRIISLDGSPPIDLKEDVLRPLFNSDDKLNQILSLHNSINMPRDCIKVLRLAKSIPSNNGIDSFSCAVQMVDNSNMETFPVSENPIQFVDYPLDLDCWNRVSTQIDYCLHAKCHVLLVGETDWIARKYCNALQNEGMTEANYLYCSSIMSTEPLIGKYSLESDNSLLFSPSVFINMARDGLVCKMYSIHKLPPAVVNRIIPFLDKSVSNEDFQLQLIENKKDRKITVSDNFIVVATTSEEGFKSMMPSLRSRFVVIHLEKEDSRRFEMNVDADENLLFGSYNSMLEGVADNIFEKRVLFRSITYVDEILSMNPNEMINCIKNQTLLSVLTELNNQIPCINELFYSLLQNRATVLYGPKNSGKSYAVSELVKKCSIVKTYTISLCKDTSFSSLMGYTDHQGAKHEGKLREAMENNYLLIFENAENLSGELFDCLEPILDPLVSRYWYETSNCPISEHFRVLFVFTGTEPLSFPFPSYIPLISMKGMDKETVKSRCCSLLTGSNGFNARGDETNGDNLRYTRDFFEHLVDYAYNRIPTSELFIFRDLCFDTDVFKLCVALYADRNDRVSLIEGMLRKWESENNAPKDLIEKTLVALRTPEIKIQRCSETSSNLFRGSFKTTCSISEDKLNTESPSLLRSLFSLTALGWKGKETPILLVGEDEVVAHLTKVLDSNRIQIHCTRSTNYLDLIGNSVSQPGSLIRGIMSKGCPLIVFQNLEYLNEQMRSRIYTMLFNIKDSGFFEFEENGCNSLSRSVKGVLSTCTESHLGMIENKDKFIQIYCPSLNPSLEAYNGFKMDMDYPLSVLKKALMIKDLFEIQDIVPLYVMCLESDFMNRDELLENYKGQEMYNSLVWYFSECDAEFDVVQLCKLFIPLVTVPVEKHFQNVNIPRIIVQMWISIQMAYECHIPLIFEGERGIKYGWISNEFCRENEYEVECFGCFNNTTEEDLNQFLLKKRNEKTLLFLDQIDRASKPLQETVLNILYHWKNKESVIINETEVNIPSETIIVCSAQTHTLLSSYYDLCLTHRAVQYSKFEINMLIDSQFFRDKVEDLATMGYIFRLEDLNKLNLLFFPEGEDLYILWILFACSKPKNERQAIEKMLGCFTNDDVIILRDRGKCSIKSFFEIEIECNSENDWDEWSLTATERFTLFKIVMTIRSWRFSLMLMSDSFSGRTFVVSMLAKMKDKELIIISLDSESTVSDLFGKIILPREKDSGYPDSCTIEKAMEKGSWVLIQGIENASSEVISYISNICEEQITSANRENQSDLQENSSRSNRQINSDFRMFFSVSTEAADKLCFSDSCLYIYCDSITTQRDIQELYLLNNPNGKPSIFGEEEANHFDRCLSVIHSKNTTTFANAFGAQPVDHEIVARGMNLHSFEYTIYDLLMWRDEQLAAKRLTEYLRDIIYFSPSIPKSVISLLKEVKIKFKNQFVVILVNLFLSFLDDDNNNLVKQQLDRWKLAPVISPRPRTTTDLLKNQNVPLSDLFECSSHELLQMLFLSNLVRECPTILKDPDLDSFTKDLFSYLDSFAEKQDYRSDILESAFDSIDVLQGEISKLPEQLEIFSLRELDFHNWVGESIALVEKAIAKLPEALQSNPHLSAVYDRFLEYREKVHNRILISILDSKEAQRNAFNTVMNAAIDNTSIQNMIRDSFPDAMIPCSIAEALVKCINVDYRDIYHYPSQRNIKIVKISHLLYKLQYAKDYLNVLSEYEDVLSEDLRINIKDVLRSFQYIFIAIPHIITLLNAKLKKILSDLNWKELIQDYGQYPFLLPQERSEKEVKASLHVLMRRIGYYSEWVLNNQRVPVEERSELLLNEIYEGGDSGEFHLASVDLVNKIDNDEDLDRMSYHQATCTDTHWNALFTLNSTPIILIPPMVLRMERIYYDEKQVDDENKMIIWNEDCTLSKKEKQRILCSRKQTLLGRIILDALNIDDLKEPLLKSLHQQNTVESVMSYHIELLRDSFQTSLDAINNELNAKKDVLKDAENDLEETTQEALRMKNSIHDDCEKVVKELNDNSYKRMKTIEMYSFMMAVNHLSQEEILGYQSKWLWKQRKLFGYYPFSDVFTPFSIHIIWISKNTCCDKIVVSAPNGMEEYAKNFTIDINSKVQRQLLKYHDGHLIVLPYAPFKWKCQVDIVSTGTETVPTSPASSTALPAGSASSPPDPLANASTYMELFFSSKITELKRLKYSPFGKCRTDMDMLILLKLLQCMVYIKELVNFKYEISDISEDMVVNYFLNLPPSAVAKERTFFIDNNHFSLFTSAAHNLVGCDFINGKDDLLPVRMSNNMIKMHWEVAEMLTIPNTLDPIQVVYLEPEMVPCNDNITAYNEKIQLTGDKRNAFAELQNQEAEIEKRLRDKESFRDNFMKYYLPDLSPVSVDTTVRLTLHDALIVFFDGQEVSIALPENEQFLAPDNVIGPNGNKLNLPLVLTNRLLAVQLMSNDCIVIQENNGFSFIVTEMNEGRNILNFEVDAKYCGAEKVTAHRKFTIVFHHGRETISPYEKNKVMTELAPYQDISRYLDTIEQKDVIQFSYHFSYILSFILCTSREEDKKKLLSIVQNVAGAEDLCQSIREEAQFVLNTLGQTNELSWSIRKSVQYQAITSRFSNLIRMSAKEQFHYLLDRSNDTDVVGSLDKQGDSLQVRVVPVSHTPHKLPQFILNSIYSQSSQLVIRMRHLLEKQCRSSINLIVDANCSMSRDTCRIRSIITSILITLCVECGFKYRLFVSGGQNKVIEIKNNQSNIEYLYSMIFDMEFLKIIDSSPFDVLLSDPTFNRDDFFFIISDGFCKQLLTKDNRINKILTRFPNMYLFFLSQTSQSLDKEEMKILDETINPKFYRGSKRFNIKTEFDLLGHTEKLIKLPFAMNPYDYNKDCEISGVESLSSEWIDSFPKEWPRTKSMARVNQLGTQNEVNLPAVVERDTFIKPLEQQQDLLSSLNSQIPSTNLVDAFSKTMLSTSSPAHVIYSSKGINVSYSRYNQQFDSSKVDFFEWNIPSISSRCAVSIVVDCSSRSFSLLNRKHALFTVFSVLRNLSTMDISCADVWLAQEKTVRVATGISGKQLWSNNIVDPIYLASLKPSMPTSIVHTIKMAGATCGLRELPTLMLVLTNGVANPKIQTDIQDVIQSIKVRVVGIGIGSYLNGFKSFLPEMVWNANPMRLADSLTELLAPSLFDVENGVMELTDENERMKECELSYTNEIVDIMKGTSNL